MITRHPGDLHPHTSHSYASKFTSGLPFPTSPLTYPQQQLRDDNVGELSRQVERRTELRVLHAGV